jgi:uncharacterized membrane protein YdjX (TVP38/TMEM64 family)
LRSYRRVGARLVAAIAIATGAAVSIYLVRRGTIDPSAIRDIIAGSSLAPLVFILLQIGASLVFIPRTVLGIAAGLLFGFAWGSVLAITGALAGAAAGFALWRWIGRGRVDLEATPWIGPLIERAEKDRWRAVAIVRLIPALPHSVANTALALTKIGWADYLIGSFIGMLPMTLVQVDVGAAGGQVLDGRGGWLISLGLLALLFGSSVLIRRAAVRHK